MHAVNDRAVENRRTPVSILNADNVTDFETPGLFHVIIAAEIPNPLRVIARRRSSDGAAIRIIPFPEVQKWKTAPAS